MKPNIKTTRLNTKKTAKNKMDKKKIFPPKVAIAEIHNV